jgi:GlpG protein
MEQQWENVSLGIVTKIILATCCLLFILSGLLNPSISFTNPQQDLPIFSSPIEQELLYDYPKTYQLVNKLITLYGYTSLNDSNQLPAEGRLIVKEINQTPYWQGIYDYTLYHQLDQISLIPMFEKIRQGEIWRLFTPCLLHGSLLHIFFNMLWLLILGKQLESNLLPFKYILFILLTAILSNTAQYLMSGPNFIGFSGVIAAMIGFIWMKQRDAPLEGYYLDRRTLIFISIFIFGIAALQLGLFILQYFFYFDASPGIANTAHLVGAASGIILGKTPLFKRK